MKWGVEGAWGAVGMKPRRAVGAPPQHGVCWAVEWSSEVFTVGDGPEWAEDQSQAWWGRDGRAWGGEGPALSGRTMVLLSTRGH